MVTLIIKHFNWKQDRESLISKLGIGYYDEFTILVLVVVPTCLFSSFSQYDDNYSTKFEYLNAWMECLGFEPWTTGWQVQTNQLSCGGPQTFTRTFFQMIRPNFCPNGKFNTSNFFISQALTLSHTRDILRQSCFKCFIIVSLHIFILTLYPSLSLSVSPALLVHTFLGW